MRIRITAEVKTLEALNIYRRLIDGGFEAHVN